MPGRGFKKLFRLFDLFVKHGRGFFEYSFIYYKMSCNYADGLSPYEHKGVLGATEKFDSADTVKEKCSTLVQFIKEAKHIVIHSGAGISTSSGIPDFRGPNGVWTLEEKGLKPDINISFADAKPTKTHMAIKRLVDDGIVHYIVSQNIDGLHLKSGIKREYLAELHGNMFIDQCNFCKRQFVRSSPAPTVGQRSSGAQCHGGGSGRRPCRGKLHDTILDWEHSLPDDDLEMSDKHSCMADLSICLGTTLQINPSGNIPLNTLRYGGKMVICNLQPTKHDNKADLIINTYVDDVFDEVMKLLGLQIPDYKHEDDPVFKSTNEYIEWTIPKKLILQTKTKFRKKCDGGVKRRVLVKREYKIQQDELKIQSKKLKMEKKYNESKKKVKIDYFVSDEIDDSVIELSTSDEDDVILVNDKSSIGPSTNLDTVSPDKEEKKVKIDSEDKKQNETDIKEDVSVKSVVEENSKIKTINGEVKPNPEIENGFGTEENTNQVLNIKIEPENHQNGTESKVKIEIKIEQKLEIVEESTENLNTEESGDKNEVAVNIKNESAKSCSDDNSGTNFESKERERETHNQVSEKNDLHIDKVLNMEKQTENEISTKENELNNKPQNNINR